MIPPRRVISAPGRATFGELRRRGRRVRRGPVTVTWLAAGPEEGLRVAYAVGRRVGGAVTRNRLRRRLRAIMQEFASALEPGAYLVGASGGAVPLSYGELRTAVSDALGALPGALKGEAGPDAEPRAGSMPASDPRL